MREVGAKAIPDLVLRHAGQGGAAVQAVVRALDAAIGAATGELDTGYAERERRWLHENCEPRLMGWVAAAAPAEPLAAVCAQLADDFERLVATFLPPAVAAPCRSQLAALEQTLVDAAGLLNTPVLVEQATADPRYGAAKNAAVPRKIGSKLWLYDCINCDKCVPVCPNDANFVYEGPEIEVRYDDVEIGAKGEIKARQDAGGVFKIAKGHQLANYADACNDCGNCDVFCPEDGGPYVEKPRFFGSAESYRKYAGRNGFYLETAGGAARHPRHDRRQGVPRGARPRGGTGALRRRRRRAGDRAGRQPGRGRPGEGAAGHLAPPHRDAAVPDAAVPRRGGRERAARQLRQRGEPVREERR